VIFPPASLPLLARTLLYLSRYYGSDREGEEEAGVRVEFSPTLPTAPTGEEDGRAVTRSSGLRLEACLARARACALKNYIFNTR
jgi:hypothetical protein